MAASSLSAGPPRPAMRIIASANIASRSPAIGGALVPFGRLGVVALDAERVGIELAEHRHRLGVAVVLRALGRQIERGLVLAALIGAVDQIGVGIVGRRRGVAVSGQASVSAPAWRGCRFLRRRRLDGLCFGCASLVLRPARRRPGGVNWSCASGAPPSMRTLARIDDGRRIIMPASSLPARPACRSRHRACLIASAASISAAAAPRGSFQTSRRPGRNPRRRRRTSCASSSARHSRRRAARTVRPTIAAARRSRPTTAAGRLYPARRTARSPRRPRLRPSSCAAWTARRRRRCDRASTIGSASCIASIPVRCAPSAPARATSSACPSSSSAAPLSWIAAPAP